ncbi:metallophosphoesterase family protein [Niabella sp. 22666]|uniref:metallophosphoesterase family protein n=1 Tax=Niabella sp. 22666 TaxID=3453954 RepID=UPI003F8589E2
MKQSIFITALLLSAVVSYAQQPFSFVFMSDVHYTEKFDAPKAFRKVVDTINAIKPDFVLVGGDIVYDALRVSEQEVTATTNAYLAIASKIKAPLHYAIGNHEVFKLYDRQADTTNAIFGKRFYEKYFGKRYYSFNHKGWHFMVLDNIFITHDRKYKGKIDSIQMEWIKEDLQTIDAKTPVAIVAHVPFITTLSQWYGGGTNANDDKVAAEDTHKVLACFKSHNLKLILQGHLHYFEALNVMDKTLVITAPSVSGKWWRGKQHNVEEGFIRLNINGDKVTYDYIDYGWEAKKSKQVD